MSITRRTVLAAAPAATLGGSALAQTQAPAQTSSAASTAGQQAPGFYRYRVGDIEVTAVNDGAGKRPLEGFIRNADLADVKKALEEAFLPTDAFANTFTSQVLNLTGRLVVIDPGFGDSGPSGTGRWMANFRAAGFDPAQVGTVLITHFHADHISGLRLKDGTAVFPKAEIVVPAAEWAFWMDDAKMAQAPEAAKAGFQNSRRVFAPMANDVKKVEPGQEVAPGVTAVATYGHTPGHTAYLLASGDKRYMMLGDVANHPALFVRYPDWSAVFDMDADTARTARRKMLDIAASDRIQVAFYHAPFPATGFIAKDGAGYRYVPIQWSPAL
jgi:glyoxylase-like metal-dependent hydrolase (beta-lactamase superfamily II)